MLVPCAMCARHVRASEAACPFCRSPIAVAPPRAMPTQRLGRAATFAFGAAIATSAIGCGTSTTPEDAGTDAYFGTFDAAYGGPPHDGSVAPDTFAAPDAGVSPPYGAPPDDGGPDDTGPDAGNLAGAYGGPPVDGGP